MIPKHSGYFKIGKLIFKLGDNTIMAFLGIVLELSLPLTANVLPNSYTIRSSLLGGYRPKDALSCWWDMVEGGKSAI